jgi:hypothetical protein
MTRLERILPALRAVYAAIVIVVPPHTAPDVVACLRAWFGAGLVVSQDWAHGRHLALAHALDFPGDFVQYADLDRLIRWVETRPEEWARVVAEIPQHECLVIGRTDAAWETHPRALRDTERITSHVFSAILGQELDLSAGAKGFSRAAAAWIIRNSRPERALGKDSEWVILAHRGGFRLGDSRPLSRSRGRRRTDAARARGIRRKSRKLEDACGRGDRDCGGRSGCVEEAPKNLTQ